MPAGRPRPLSAPAGLPLGRGTWRCRRVARRAARPRARPVRRGAGLGIGLAMDGQLGPRRLADRGRVGPAAGGDRPGDGGREPLQQAAGGGRRLRYPLDRLGHPDRRRQEVDPRRQRADHAQLERPGGDREQTSRRGQVVGRERRADVIRPGEGRGAEGALLIPLEAGDPGGGERRAEERLVHGGDELGGGRHLQQAERLVDLLAQRQQRPRPGGRLGCSACRRDGLRLARRAGSASTGRPAPRRPRRARPPTPARPTSGPSAAARRAPGRRPGPPRGRRPAARQSGALAPQWFQPRSRSYRQLAAISSNLQHVEDLGGARPAQGLRVRQVRGCRRLTQA